MIKHESEKHGELPRVHVALAFDLNTSKKQITAEKHGNKEEKCKQLIGDFVETHCEYAI